MNEWNIQSRAHGCQCCGQAFADKQPYHTLLFDEKQHFRREDVCDSCWQSQFSQGASDRRGFVSRWQGVYEAPPPVAPDPIQRETAETLLRKLIEQDDPKHRAATYILAVMLERKRMLKVKEQLVRDGQRIFVYEHPRSGDVFTIADPDLQLDQLEEVQRDVAELLERGLNSPPAEAASPDTADATPPAEPVEDEPPASEDATSEESGDSPSRDPSSP